jgi:hypothetical protein
LFEQENLNMVDKEIPWIESKGFLHFVKFRRRHTFRIEGFSSRIEACQKGGTNLDIGSQLFDLKTWPSNQLKLNLRLAYNCNQPTTAAYSQAGFGLFGSSTQPQFG